LKQFRNERVKKWLVDLQDALYLADDLVDELCTKAATATPRDPGNSYDWSRTVDSIIDDGGVNVIQKIVGKLESVVGRKGKLGLEKSAKLDTSWRIPSTSLVVSSDIFGREKDKENIIKFLLDDTCDAKSPETVTVIPIVGMGGIGKTTLAQLVYNDAEVVGKFDTRAWVCVAENPDPLNVTRTIIGALDSSPCNMDHFDSLQTHLKEKLSRKTFLVVLDDVWNDEQDMWDEFLKPFRYGNNGSKILLTTCSEKVASVFAANNLHYRLSLLLEEDCWSVFLKHSSISTNSKEYVTLEPVGRKIVEKCKGLPLAVKTLGGLLRNKYNEGDWEKILESEIWELSEDKSELIHLRYLDLSCTLIEILPESICKLYNLQTLKLKSCYSLKILPNHMHDIVTLCHLDIQGAYELEEMQKKMSKLMHLNFLSNYIIGEQEDNGIRELGTMDNLHGSFCISKLENVKNSGEALEAKMGNKKHISTLNLLWSFDGDNDIDDTRIERDILDNLRPHENLKELSIVRYRGETFPEWLGFSCYLSMTKLMLGFCMNCCELPWLGQLPSLRHLLIRHLDRLEKIDFEIYKNNNGSFQRERPFKSLEILEFEDMHHWREWHFPNEFDGFPRLRILTIKFCPLFSGDLPDHLPALEVLNIAGCEKLACSMRRTPKLQQLYVEGHSFTSYGREPNEVAIKQTQLVKSVLEWLPHIQPPRVERLCISMCQTPISISTDYLPASLQSLQISVCPKLIFSEQLQHKSLTEINLQFCYSLKLLPLGSFPNLKKLTISLCQSLEYVVVPQALSSLGYLSISNCPSLVSLPLLGLAAPYLEELHICNCPEIDRFAEECLPPSLKTLEVDRCQKLASWITSNILQSQGLIHLGLGSCFDVKSFPSEGCFPTSLESLKFWNFPNLETLNCKGLHHLTSLKNLAITDCEKLENVTDENLLASIANIYIGGECPLRRKLEEMEHPRIHFVCYEQGNPKLSALQFQC
ncbi:hypothetical protein PIB30_036439, partial [Stylosanthes scabra]|nr:hypothetical protein [Stylosanthes scabra]